ncbi:MAG: IS607 family element RNA-guided endonuclease TnpB [Actinomycetota bacterium]|nr:IS607 family element RNA-guided endonuclease TnpB [Actinomycetota bacterium]
MLVTQAYRFELDPNDKCRSKLASHAGAARFAYNWGVSLVSDHLAARRALVVLAIWQGAGREDAECWADGLLGPLPWTLPALRRAWNQAKVAVAPWWAENSKEAYNSGLDALARGLDAWSKSRRGARKGPRVGFPRFKTKNGARRSFKVTTGVFEVTDSRHVRLARIGVIRTKEPTAKLAGLLDAGAGRVLSATVSQSAGRWYVAFGVEVTRPEYRAAPGRVVGVDVGVKSLAVLSTGEVVPNPKHLSTYQRRMARLQAQCARRAGPARGQAPSKRWVRSSARLGRAHAKVASARTDGLHKLTTRLVKTHETVVVENLNVAGMTASARGSGHWRGKAGLNRAVLDTAPGELRRQLAYKAAWYGSRLVVADRWYPSSKTCSRCKTVKAKLSLSERTYRCERCGLVIDRDLNAATNLAFLVESVTSIGTASGAGTGTLLRRGSRANAQGEERFMGSPRCSSTNCEDGTSSELEKTVTAARQQVAPKPALVGSDR